MYLFFFNTYQEKMKKPMYITRKKRQQT